MSTPRIYLVKAAGKERLVKAPNRPQAVNHVAADLITASVASQDDLVRLLTTTKVEVPGGEKGEGDDAS